MERPPLIIAGNSHPQLACNVASLLGADYATGALEPYGDGEINVQLSDSVRRRDVFIIQSTCPPDVNGACMELFLMTAACKASSAGEITVISPYTGYAKADRYNEKRTAISIAVFLKLLHRSGADRFATVDIHQEASLGAFDGPSDHIFASELFVQKMKIDIERERLKNVVIGATDQGGVKMIEAYARLLREAGVDISGTAYAIQNRNKITNKKEYIGVTGDVEGADVFVIDDQIASGSSAVSAGDKFKEKGAKSIRLFAPHGLFLDSRDHYGNLQTSIDKFRDSSIEKITTTDTVELRPDVLKADDYANVVGVTPLIAAAIECIHRGDSMTNRLRSYLGHYQPVG
ncbi:MAG: ribose-phosphate diphosphokinase [Candidatus Daviesbacteria bacterium]|nr:ribose-phosphate diphosphokinase [Candidatus Daviesbacteria bacterium]